MYIILIWIIRDIMNMFMAICTTLCGQIKGHCRAIFLIFPCNQGNILYILPGKVVSLIHTLIYRMLQNKVANIYIVELVTFTSGMEFCINNIKNAIIFIVADIYE